MNRALKLVNGLFRFWLTNGRSPGISLEYSNNFPHSIEVSTASTCLDAIEAQAVEPAAADAVVAAAKDLPSL